MYQKHWRRITLLLGIMILFAVVGCGESGDDDENPAGVGDLWPVAVGNSWLYHHTYDQGVDTLLLSVTDELTYQNKTALELIASHRWYHNDGYTWDDTLYLAIEDENVYLADVDSYNPDAEWELKFVFDGDAVGEVYFEEQDSFSLVQRSLAEVGASVTTPAGTFNNVWVFDEMTDMSSTDYTFIEHWLYNFEPGVGPVTWEACYSVYSDETIVDEPYRLVDATTLD